LGLEKSKCPVTSNRRPVSLRGDLPEGTEGVASGGALKERSQMITT
jgi:hypothetical protein